MEVNNTKTLWLLMYHTGQADPKGTTGHLEFFYAYDERDAREAANKFKVDRAAEIGEPVYEEYLEKQARGFTVHGAILSGKIEVNPDGTAKEDPLKGSVNYFF